MNGLGFLVWKLSATVPPAAQIAAWKEIGVQWISIKVREYTQEWNRNASTNSGSMRLEDLINACKEAGIKVGTWQFIYTTSLATQAKLVSEDIKKFGLDHLLLDVEENGRVYPYAHWKTFPKYKTRAMALAYLDALTVPDNFPVGLCSYRYPESHREVPWESFLYHPKVNMITPQVYWVGAYNPGEQTAISLNQYRKMSDKPFYPIGSSYAEGGWKPTAQQIREFTQISQQHFGTWGWYRWGHAKLDSEWLQAMQVEAEYPDPPPPPPDPQKPTHELAFLLPDISALRIRSGPSLSYSTIGYVQQDHPIVEVLERRLIDAGTEWFRIGYKQWSAAKYNGRRYLEVTDVHN